MGLSVTHVGGHPGCAGRGSLRAEAGARAGAAAGPAAQGRGWRSRARSSSPVPAIPQEQPASPEWGRWAELRSLILLRSRIGPANVMCRTSDRGQRCQQEARGGHRAIQERAGFPPSTIRHGGDDSGWERRQPWPDPRHPWSPPLLALTPRRQHFIPPTWQMRKPRL